MRLTEITKISITTEEIYGFGIYDFHSFWVSCGPHDAVVLSYGYLQRPASSWQLLTE